VLRYWKREEEPDRRYPAKTEGLSKYLKFQFICRISYKIAKRQTPHKEFASLVSKNGYVLPETTQGMVTIIYRLRV
jgi:hypothetical protein